MRAMCTKIDLCQEQLQAFLGSTLLEFLQNSESLSDEANLELANAIKEMNQVKSFRLEIDKSNDYQSLLLKLIKSDSNEQYELIKNDSNEQYELIKSDSNEQYELILAMGDLFISDRQIDYFLAVDGLATLDELLSELANKKICKVICFALSQIAAGTYDHRQQLMEQESLMDKVMILVGKQDRNLWIEAVKVLTNFITVETDPERLMNFIYPSQEKYDELNITQQLAKSIDKAKDDSSDILVEILEAIHASLQLDVFFQVEQRDKQVSYHFEMANGPSYLEVVSPHQNQKVNELVEKIMTEFFQG